MTIDQRTILLAAIKLFAIMVAAPAGLETLACPTRPPVHPDLDVASLRHPEMKMACKISSL